MVSLHAALAVLALSGASDTVFYDFYADWCAPCRAMGPTIDALVTQGYPVRKVNIDRDRELAAKFGVQSVPCYVMVVNGREVERVSGSTTFSRLERMCKRAAEVASGERGGAPQASGSREVPAVGSPVVSLVSCTVPRTDATRETSAAATALASVGHSAADGPVATSLRSPGEGSGNDPSSESHLVAASVRLRIQDDRGHSCGTGTIIDARQGEALILTCGHIFRDSKGKGPIEVDLFGANPAHAVPGRLIGYDLERDLGLLCIRTPGPVAVARVAPPGYQVRPGHEVVSVGCNNGDRPSARRSQVTSLDKYLGPPNVQVAGQPVEGRSGGGLFSAEGLVIGVCNAADPADKEGLFAAMASIHTQLDQAGLSYIYEGGEAGRDARLADNGAPTAAPPTRGALVAVNPPAMPKRMPNLSDDGPGKAISETSLNSSGTQRRVAPVESSRLSGHEQAALDEIRRRLQDGAEVICVVRSRQDPQAKSEVIMLDKVSPGFLRQLAAETATDRPMQPVTPPGPTRTVNHPSMSAGHQDWAGSTDPQLLRR